MHIFLAYFLAFTDILVVKSNKAWCLEVQQYVLLNITDRWMVDGRNRHVITSSYFLASYDSITQLLSLIYVVERLRVPYLGLMILNSLY